MKSNELFDTASLTFMLEQKFLHQRFFLHELEEKLQEKIQLCWNDIDAVNLADYNLMFEFRWQYDVDFYCLIDRHWRYYITEIAVNIQ